jgi:hypothetical protein
MRIAEPSATVRTTPRKRRMLFDLLLPMVPPVLSTTLVRPFMPYRVTSSKVLKKWLSFSLTW